MRYCGALPRRFVANASARRRFFASNGGVLARRSSPPRLRARRVGVRQERLAEPLLPVNASARYEPSSRAGATGASTLVVVRVKPEAVLLGLAGRGYLDVDAAQLLS